MTTANAIAAELSRLAALDADGESLSAARLHKLLYYCQGWHLAWYAQPLFGDRIEAGENGPVVPTLNPTAPPSNGLPAEARDSVAQVWSHYRQFSAVGLREKAKAEAPWRTHRLPGSAPEIPVAALASFFGEEFRRQTGEEPGAMAQVAADLAAGRVITLDELRAEWGL